MFRNKTASYPGALGELLCFVDARFVTNILTLRHDSHNFHAHVFSGTWDGAGEKLSRKAIKTMVKKFTTKI